MALRVPAAVFVVVVVVVVLVVVELSMLRGTLVAQL